jgi:hypothetical protein
VTFAEIVERIHAAGYQVSNLYEFDNVINGAGWRANLQTRDDKSFEWADGATAEEALENALANTKEPGSSKRHHMEALAAAEPADGLGDLLG